MNYQHYNKSFCFSNTEDLWYTCQNILKFNLTRFFICLFVNLWLIILLYIKNFILLDTDDNSQKNETALDFCDVFNEIEYTTDIPPIVDSEPNGNESGDYLNVIHIRSYLTMFLVKQKYITKLKYFFELLVKKLLS